MWRLALLLWVMGATALAGIFIVVVLMTPSLAPMKFIPVAAGLGAIVAIPAAIVAAKMIRSRTGGI
ncbi:MAG: hypothetical protein ACK5JM_02870 [Rhodoblastus sp.]